jgi:hypothetical protein
MATAASLRRFELPFEALTGNSMSSPARIDVPAGPSCIAFDDTPRLADAGTLLVEPVHRGRDAALLLMAAPDVTLRVNGLPCGQIVCVHAGDVVESGIAGWVTQVEMTTRWQLGTPPESLLGERCPICRRVFDERTTVWVCPVCGTGLHLEPGTSAETLKCLDLASECLQCHLAIDRDDETLLEETTT